MQVIEDEFIRSNYMCPQLSMRERFSSLTKFVRTTAYVQRFCHNARYANEKQTGHFKVSDLQTALCACVYMVQHTFCHGQTADLKTALDMKKSSELHGLCPFLDRIKCFE